jgi:hypothetical protein
MPATTVAELGRGSGDGQLRVLEYGGQRVDLRWDSNASRWIGDERFSIKMMDAWTTAVRTSGSGTYMYYTAANGNPGEIGRSGFGWTPQAIHRPDAAFAAGLVLQEKLDYLFWAWTGADAVFLATVLFPLNPTDVISTLISASAGSYVGVQVQADPGIRRFQSTGWVNSGQQTSAKTIFAPHYYTMTTTPSLSGSPKIEYATARYRWVSPVIP